MAVLSYRQGDVLLVKKAMPGEVDYATRRQIVADKIVAAGEATGHHHRMTGTADVVKVGWRDLYVNVAEPSVLTHEEHGPITVDPGAYEVRIQREYEGEFKERRVRD